MSLPTAIVFSSLLLAVVILYGFTKDRWPWKRIAIWTAGGVVLLLVVGAAGVWWLTRADTAGDREQEAEERSRHRVEIGDNYDRVLQRQGVPDTTVALDSATFALAYLEPGEYTNDLQKAFVFSADSILTGIQIFAGRYSGMRQDWIPIDGIVVGTYRDSVVANLGRPCHEGIEDTYTLLRFETDRRDVIRYVRVSHGEGEVTEHGWFQGECDQ